MPTPVPMFRPSWSVIAAREQSIASEARPQTAESASPMLSREVLVIPKPRIDRATAVLYKLASFASDSLGQDASGASIAPDESHSVRCCAIVAPGDQTPSTTSPGRKRTTEPDAALS